MKTKLPAKKKSHWLRGALLVIGVAVLTVVVVEGYAAYRFGHDLAATRQDNTSDEESTCGAAATQIALGFPYRGVGKAVAYFTTDGTDVYMSARHFDHGFLAPKIGVTGIWIGNAATLPTFDEQSGQVSNTKVSLTISEGKHKKAQLPAGRYWLWTSTGGDIVAASCGQISGQQPDGQTAPVIPNVYHGGACDDTTYYANHTRECAVQ